MSATTTSVQLSATVTDLVKSAVSTILELEFEQNMRRLFYKLLDEALLLCGFRGPSFKTDISPLTVVTPIKRFPLHLRHMSEIRKARLRATYAREIALFPPGAANLPLAQRFLAAPITLSGPDGAVNVALRPSSTHIALGHEYSPEPTPCPTPCLSTYAHGQADVRATLRGATAALEALVRGTVDEEWLNAPALKSKPLSAPWMTRSYAQREDPLMAPRMATRSPARIGGFKVDNVRGMGTPSGLRAAYSSGSTESELSDIHENIPQDVAAWFAAINERKE